MDAVQSERRAPDDRRGRGACQPWLRAPAAPVTGLGLHRAHGLHRGPDLDGAPIRRPPLVVLLPALGPPLRSALPAQGRQQIRQRQGPRAGLRRDPDVQARPNLAPHGAAWRGSRGAWAVRPARRGRRPGRTGCGPPPTGASCGYGARPRNAWTPSPMPASAASCPHWPACCVRRRDQPLPKLPSPGQQPAPPAADAPADVSKPWPHFVGREGGVVSFMGAEFR